MNPNQALWEKGDFTQIAAFMRASGEDVAHSLGITPTMRCLDLGCGDGTTALPLARLGATVTGIDIARNLVEAGRERARRAGLDRLTFQEGDACDLHDIADHTFDLTVSMFGAMFALQPIRTAEEMVRVTKPGGRIVMGNWIPDDPTSFVSEMVKVLAEYLPPSEKFVDPLLWGITSQVVERFGHAGVETSQISFSKHTFAFTSADQNPTHFIDLYRQYFGPAMLAFDAATANGRDNELQRQLVALAYAHNIGVSTRTSIPATYLRVTVQL